MRIPAGFIVALALLLSACGGGTDAPSPPGPPAIATGSPPGGTTGVYYAGFSFYVASGGVAPFTWSATGAVPPGLSLSGIGQLTGTPQVAGAFDFTVKVTDASTPALTATLPVRMTIAGISINAGQVLPAGTHGSPYGYVIASTGGIQPLTWTVTAGTLPPGIVLNPDGTLGGTPTLASPTPYAFTVTVTDSSTPTPASDSAVYSIAISDPPAPSIIDTPPPTATVGSPYGFQFSATDGLAPLVWSASGTSIGGLAIDPGGLLGGTPTTPGIFPVTLTVTDALNRSPAPVPFTVRIAMARPAVSFTPTGSMTAARDGHSATLLQDGHVLIAGGNGGSASFVSAELYDQTTQVFTATGPMTIGRTGHTATLLAVPGSPNHGKVLLVGGTGDQTAELYDPGTGAFRATSHTVARHLGQTATLLKDGRVLVAGGETASAELFDPASGTFTATGSMAISRTGHTATLLPDGRVLVAGGMQDVPPTLPVLLLPGVSSAEIYDPASGTFSATGSMGSGQARHTATLLADGTVLVVAGDGAAEVFSPATGSFSLVGGTSTGYRATATLRNDGTVLVTGGIRAFSIGTAMLFAPECAGFVSTGPLTTARDGHTATLLADGSVLVVGGTSYTRRCYGYGGGRGGCSNSTTVLSSAQLFK